MSEPVVGKTCNVLWPGARVDGGNRIVGARVEKVLPSGYVEATWGGGTKTVRPLSHDEILYREGMPGCRT